MAVVLVHGNPESDAVWDRFVVELTSLGYSDIIRLSPPGFGVPSPEGWEPEVENYRRWLIASLEEIEGPIDIVAHDLGAVTLFDVLATRPSLVRSWTADCFAGFHEDHQPHSMAAKWQEPGGGERLISAMLERPLDTRQADFEQLGLDPVSARNLAEALNEDMGRCILTWYRGAVRPFLQNVHASLLEVDLPPGLVVLPTAEHLDPYELAAEAAASLGVATLTLEGQSHWWMCTAEREAAQRIHEFWLTVSDD